MQLAHQGLVEPQRKHLDVFRTKWAAKARVHLPSEAFVVRGDEAMFTGNRDPIGGEPEVQIFLDPLSDVELC